ncbi:MAG: pilus assembly protein [Endomicrobium sp.]|jgi:hypothetical protein|nr:pilus assembly protein [Endomicrobium sp.]
MAYLNFIKQSDGQALVEAALIAPLILLFLFAVLWFAQIMLTWQQISSAARYGADLIAYTPFSARYIESDIRDYLCNTETVGRIIDPKKLTIKIEINDYNHIGCDFDIKTLLSFTALRSANLLGILKTFIDGFSKKSFIEITYTCNIPGIFKITGKKDIKLTARAAVLSGTGSAGALKRQK